MNRELPLPRPFDGDAVSLKPSVWITNHDVTAAGGRIEATMAGVFSHPTATMPDGRVLASGRFSSSPSASALRRCRDSREDPHTPDDAGRGRRCGSNA